MLAKKAAERAKRDFELRMAKEAEDRRLSAIPQWKRDLMARKEEAEYKLKYHVYFLRIFSRFLIFPFFLCFSF